MTSIHRTVRRLLPLMFAVLCPPLLAESRPVPIPPPPVISDSTTWVNRLWIAEDADAPTGKLLLFLDNGALLMDSCVETWRLVRWEKLTDSTVVWLEDTARIEAGLELLDVGRLKLTLKLAGEPREEYYREASQPFVCPDLPR